MCLRAATGAVAFVFLMFVCVPTTAWAQVSASDQEAAKAHFLAGSSYYESANYSDAVKEFNEAYRLSKRPDLLYNIALGYERLGDFDNAISTLKRYLVEKLNAPDRNLIEARIKNLERLREERLRPPAPTPTPQPDKPVAQESAPRSKRSLGTLGYAGIGTGAVGALLLLGSVGTGLTAKKKSDQLLRECPTRMNCDPRLQAVQTSGKRFAVATDAMIGIGAVALVAGVALIVVDLVRKPKAAPPEPTPTPTPTPTDPTQPAAPLATPPAASVSFGGDSLVVHF